jgi:hypothetical protein
LRFVFGAGIILSLVENDRPSNGSERFDREQKEVDDDRETLDNLASLLLTNTTLRSAARQYRTQEFFNNKQSISVGV